MVSSWSNGILASAAEGFASEFPEVLTLCPRHLAGEGLAPGAAGSLGVHRASLAAAAREFARARIATAGLVPLSGLGQEALAARIVFQALQARRLQYFHPVAALPGFARALSRTLRDLRLAGAAPGQLNGDLAGLLAAYEAELNSARLADEAAVFRLAAEAASAGEHPWAGLPLVLLDVDLEFRAHAAFVNALARRSPAVFAAVRPGEPVIEALAGVSVRNLDEGPARTPLDHLRRNLFAEAPEKCASPGESFELFSAPGEGLEAVEIARRMLRLAEAGFRFDEMAVLLRHPDRYQPAIEDALLRARIPAFFSRGSRRPNPSGRAFLALLSCAAENLPASRLAEYFSLGQVPETEPPPAWVPPEDELLGVTADPAPEAEPPARAALPAPRRWEQFLVDAAVIGGLERWQRRLDGLQAEWRLQGREDPELFEQLDHLRRFALPLIGALASLPKAAPWSEWLHHLGDLARRSLRDPDGVLAVLAELAPMGDVGPATLEEILEVLSERLRFLRREPPARRWGRVFVGTIEEARGRSFRAVFLPGLAEGLFPQRPQEDPLLLDGTRQAISPELRLRGDKVRQERLRLRIAAGAATERLVVSYPRMEVAEARPRVPSFYALELLRALEGRIPGIEEFERRARGAAPARLNWPAPGRVSDAIDDAEFDLVSIRQGRARHILAANAHAARSLRARWYRWHGRKWCPADGLVATDPAAAAVLEEHRLRARPWSASALDLFAVCPYRFALHGIFKLRPREDAAPLEQLDPRTRGSLFHAVQHRLYTTLQAKNLLPLTAERLAEAIPHCDATLESVAAEFAEQLAPAIGRVWDSEIQDLRTDLRGWLRFVAADDSGWEPVEFELPFEAGLSEGVLLHGRIDLLERQLAGDALRITDHKTGKPPEQIPHWVGGGKYLQPLLYSLAAEQSLGKPVAAGRLFYATQQGGYTLIEIRADQRARQVLAKLLADIDGMLSAGFLPPFPEADACARCDYRPVCGPYEPQRVCRKDLRDERLEPLFTIRGMA